MTWIRQAAAAVDPQTTTVTLTDGSTLQYGFLVMAPGPQLNFDTVPGLTAPDVTQVYQRLLAASQQHLTTFTTWATR